MQEPRRFGRSTVRNAGRRGIAEARYAGSVALSVETLPGCAPAVPRLPLSRAENHRPDRMIFLRTIQKTRQSLLALRLRKRRARSKAHAKRLCNLCQTFSLQRMGVTPSRAEFKLVQNLISGFGAGFRSKLVPQVFHELKALKLAKMFNGLQGGFHAEKFSTPHVNSRTCRQTRMKVKIGNSLRLGCQRLTDSERNHAHHQRIPRPRR